MSAIVLAALNRELDLRDWKARLGMRAKTDLGVNASELLDVERQIRDPDSI